VTAIREYGELHSLRAAELEQRIDRRADGATCVEDVIDEDDRHPFEIEVELRVADERLGTTRRAPGAHVDVVAVERDVEPAKRQLDARALRDELAKALSERDASRLDADERDGLEIVVAFDDLVRDPRQRPADRLVVEQEVRRRSDGRVRHSTPFRPRWTGLKGRCGAHGTWFAGRTEPVPSSAVEHALLDRYARLIVEVGANVQPGQIVWVVAEPSAAPLVRAVAAAAYERGALFVDPWYFDPGVKRARLEHADPATLGTVPPWYGKRLLALGDSHGVRISITPQVPPGFLDGIDPTITGRDALPALRENFQVINARTTSWTVVPWASREWARRVFPAHAAVEAVELLWEKLLYVLRLDEPDPCEAWRARLQELHDAGTRIDERRFDALRFEGPGTDLTVGLLPTSRFSSETPGMQTVDGVVHAPNLPTEEIASTPDPHRVDGIVTATKPLDVEGTVVTDLVVRFEQGRAVAIEGENAGALRSRTAVDDNASRLGEVALVDGSGRIAKTETIFFNTLLDENAASHLAFGNAYAISVGPEDRDRINASQVHIDFMIGGDEVAVTGLGADGSATPVLRGGIWQL